MTGSADLPATVDSWLKPLLKYADTSGLPGPPAEGAGEGLEPKPTYFPPWLGGNPCGFEAFSYTYRSHDSTDSYDCTILIIGDLTCCQTDSIM